MRTYLAIATLGFALIGGTADAAFRAQGNDTGGIIGWEPGPEAWFAARAEMDAQCGRWGKYAVIRSVRRVPGDFITYECRFPPQYAVEEVIVRKKRSRRVNVTIDK